MTELVIRVRADGTAQVAGQVRELNTTVGQTGTTAQQTGQRMQGLGQETRTTGQRIGELRTSTLALIGTVSAIAAGLTSATRASADFSQSMAEISTLVDDSWNLDDMAEDIRALTREFGGDIQKNAKATYDIISAGAKDGAEAMDTLTAANKLAIGGVTDVATAADGLTSALNAYGPSVGSATEVSDRFFVAVQAGKTTVDELSGSIGGVAPLASEAGVSLDALLAGTAALTATGASTSESMTRMRAAITSIITPSSQATTLAEELGIEFNATALKSQGLAGFLDQVKEATGGNVETMGRLFGSSEALTAALTLTGSQAEKFRDTLAAMGTSAGATEDAVAKMWDTPAQRAARFQAALNDVRISMGDAISNLAPLLDGLSNLVNRFNELNPNLRTAIGGILALGVALPPLVLAVKSLGIGLAVLTGPVGLLTLAAGVLGILALQSGSAKDELSAAAVAAETAGSAAAESVTGLASMTEAIETAASQSDGLSDSLREQAEQALTTARQFVAASREKTTALQQEVIAQRAAVNAQLSSFRGLISAVEETGVATREQREQFRAMRSELGQNVPALEAQERALLAQVDALEEAKAGYTESEQRLAALGIQVREHTDATRVNSAAQDDNSASTDTNSGRRRNNTGTVEGQSSAVQELIESLTGEATRQQRLQELMEDLNISRDAATELLKLENAAREDGIELTREQTEQALALIEATQDTGTAVKELGDTTKTETDLMAESWKTLNNNIQNLFANTFKDLFTGAFDGWRGLLRSMGDLFAQWAAQLASQRIMMNIGIGGAGMGASGAAMAGQGGGLGGILSGLSGGIGSVLGGLSSSIGTGLIGMGAGNFGAGMLASGTMIGNAGIFQGGMAALSNIGGLLSGGQLIAALGAAMPIVAPIALALSAFIKSTPPRAYALGDIATGDIVQRVEKKGQDATALVAMIDQIVAATGGVLDEIGGTLAAGQGVFDLHINPDRMRFSLRLDDGGLMEVDVDPEDQAAVTDAINRMMLGALARAEFDEAAAEVGAFFNALGVQMIESLPAGAAEQYVQGLTMIAAALDTTPHELYQQALEAQTGTVMESLQQQSTAFEQLARDFDGSAQGTENLAQGLTQLQQSAVQAVAQIEAARQSISETVGSALQRIELDLMSQEQQINYWLDQARGMQAQLAEATDPAQIESLANSTTEALMRAWGMMDEDRRQQEAGWLQEFLIGIDETAGEGLDRAATTVQELWENAAVNVRDALSEGAQAIASASAALQAAIPSSISVTVNQAPTGGHGLARGGWVRAASGWIGAAGQAGADSIPILVGAGEAILNRHQQRIVNGALSAQYGLDLHGLFSRESRPHSAPMSAPVPAFAGGGFVPSGGGDPRLAEDLRRAAEEIRAAAREHREAFNRFGQRLGTAIDRLPNRINVGVEIPPDYTGGL